MIHSIEDEPIWDHDKISVRKVTASQLREFRKTYAEIQSSHQQLQSENEKLTKQLEDIVMEIKKTKHDTEEIIKENEILTASLNPEEEKKPKPVYKPKLPDKSEIHSVQQHFAEVSALKEKLKDLKTQLSSTKSLWATEKVRLQSTLKTIQNQNADFDIKIQYYTENIPQTSKGKSIKKYQKKSTIAPQSVDLPTKPQKSYKQEKLEPLAIELPKKTVSEFPLFAEVSERKKEAGSLQKMNQNPRNFVFEQLIPDLSWCKFFEPKIPQENPKLVGNPPHLEFSSGETLVLFADKSYEFQTKEYAAIFFSNGDIQITFPDNRSMYGHSATGTFQYTHPDGWDYLVFSREQSEIAFSNKNRILFQDGKRIFVGVDGSEVVF